MKCRLKRLGRKSLALSLAITLITTISPIGVLAQVGPDVQFQLDKTFYQVGEAPVYSITGAAPNSQVFLSSFKNGVSTGEVDVWYGHMTDAQGNVTFSGGAWQSSDMGVWSKIAMVAGRQTPFLFVVGTIPDNVPPITDLGFTISSTQIDAASGRPYVDISAFQLSGEQLQYASRIVFTSQTNPTISEGVLLGSNLAPVYCDTSESPDPQEQRRPGIRDVIDPDRWTHPDPCTQCVVRGQLVCVRGELIDLGIAITAAATVYVGCTLAVIAMSVATAGAAIALNAVCALLGIGTLIFGGKKAKNDGRKCVCDQYARCSGTLQRSCLNVPDPAGFSCR